MFIKLRIYLHIIIGLVVGRHALENLALNKTAEMSTQRTSDSGADGAVDGNTAQTIDSASCALTALDRATEAWWRVDLNGTFAISELKIYLLDSGKKSVFRQAEIWEGNREKERKWDQCCYRGNYSQNCNTTCPVNCRDDICSIDSGECFQCQDRYLGNTCDKECETGKFGRRCLQVCNGKCRGGQTCSHINGYCPNGCMDGYIGAYCNKTCSHGLFGFTCTQECGNCLNNKTCIHTNGICDNGCASGWNGSYCNTSCEEGLYGVNCRNTCSVHCQDSRDCDIFTGTCTGGCKDGWTGQLCDKTCIDGKYGLNCTRSCGNCHSNEPCIHTNGTCARGCASGWQGSYCNAKCGLGRYGVNCSLNCREWEDGCHYIAGECLSKDLTTILIVWPITVSFLCVLVVILLVIVIKTCRRINVLNAERLSYFQSGHNIPTSNSGNEVKKRNYEELQTGATETRVYDSLDDAHVTYQNTIIQ